MKPIDDDSGFYDFELSTGRRFGANCGIVGIVQRKGGNWRITEGYDGDIYGCAPDEWTDDDADRWTPAERAELADYMIEQWTAFKRDVGQ